MSTPTVAPPAVREPYAIERFPSIRGDVLLVGYDRNGEVMVELRVPAARFAEPMVEGMRRWMRANDQPPPTPVSLVR